MDKKTYYNNQRRLRASSHIRELAGEVILSHKDLIQPLFVDEIIRERTVIPSLNEVYSDTIDTVLEQIEDDLSNGISKFLVFPVPSKKGDKDFDFSFVVSVIKKIKEQFGNSVWIAADACLCAYTTHGHCGVLDAAGSKILNGESVEVLSSYALQMAQAGADCIAPSDMMDGRIGAIRNILNEHGLDEVSIMSYSAKFSSQFYGPFRDACRSSPGKGCTVSDRRSYQISAFNPADAIASALRDIEEGADIVMVKPALPYLDIIQQIKEKVYCPVAAYHVSGEYQGLELLAKAGLLEREKAHLEVWASLKRGGVSIIITYAARHARNWIGKIIY